MLLLHVLFAVAEINILLLPPYTIHIIDHIGDRFLRVT